MFFAFPLNRCSIQKSSHLLLRQTDDYQYLAYHSLFGNLAFIDKELYEYLERLSEPFTPSKLWSDVGDKAAEVLWNSYFFVASQAEERQMINEWLAERESQIQTGYYLGGLQISSSNACNFACSYCFADVADRRSKIRQAVAAGAANISFEMASEAIRQVRDAARHHGRNRIAVKFLGREPLINWKVIHHLLESYADNQIAWAITTNGSLLSQEIAQDLKRHTVQVMVSLDGPPSVHNKMRVLKRLGGGPTYEVTEAALRHLASVGHPFGVSTVLSCVTDFDVMPGFIDRIADLGAREVELTLAMQVVELQAQVKHLDFRKFATQLADLYDYASRRGLLVHGDWVDPFHRILSTHKLRQEDRVIRPLGAGCVATEHQISLEPSGDLFPCRSMSLHYGHIQNLAAVLTSEEYRRVTMRTYYNVPYCRGCELEGHCQGTCLGSSEESSSDIYAPQENYCKVYRETTQLLLRHLGMKDRLKEQRHAW